jgi:hypothetical protein
MRWEPKKGHVPRGFCGCLGSPEEVKLVLIVAEPGDPHPAESYPAGAAKEKLFDLTFSYSLRCYRTGEDLFHRNVRRILDLCWPGLSFEEQMRRTWITESVLCSAAKEGGNVPTAVWRECKRRYLSKELSLFNNPIIAALGSKAKTRTSDIPGVCAVWAASPPGCNDSRARESWDELAGSVRLLAGLGKNQRHRIIRRSPSNTSLDPLFQPL